MYSFKQLKSGEVSVYLDRVWCCFMPNMVKAKKVFNLYNVVIKNRETGRKVVMNEEPLSYREAEIFKSRLARHEFRLEIIEKV